MLENKLEVRKERSGCGLLFLGSEEKQVKVAVGVRSLRMPMDKASRT